MKDLYIAHHFGAIAQTLTHMARAQLHPIPATRHGDANLGPLDTPPKHQREREDISRTGLSRALLWREFLTGEEETPLQLPKHRIRKMQMICLSATLCIARREYCTIIFQRHKTHSITNHNNTAVSPILSPSPPPPPPPALAIAPVLMIEV